MNYEYENIYRSLWGLAGFVIWLIAYFRLIKPAEFYLSFHYIQSKMRLLKIFVFFIGTLGWLAISISLAGPRLPLSFSESTRNVNDLFFVVDTSLSMEADDFEPNRLEVSKRKIFEFIKLRPTDRIGIVVFAERAFTLLPLTTDLNLIGQVIAEIKTKVFGHGTNIGDSLGLAVARLITSLAENKAIILLTDGVSNFGNMTPMEAAQEAKNHNIKIYSIGVGGDKGRLQGFSNRGQIPGGSYDMKGLEDISALTGGKAFQATNEEALVNVMNEINQMEKTEIKIQGQIVYNELYYQYLLWGVLLLLLCEVLKMALLKDIL